MVLMPGGKVVVDVLLEEAGLAGALGTANEREGAVGDVGKHALGGDGVVVGELLLGEAGGWVEDLVGMRKYFADGESCADGSSGLGMRQLRFCGGGLCGDGLCGC